MLFIFVKTDIRDFDLLSIHLIPIFHPVSVYGLAHQQLFMKRIQP